MRLALCESLPERLALARLVELPDEPPEWVDLMPLGEVEARDGRRWKVSNGPAVVAASRARAGTTDLVIDYEHQGYDVDAAGNVSRSTREAPAAAWITELLVADGAIRGRVEWTERAAARIQAREYRYLSPMFAFDQKTGEVRTLHGAGLTNNPALDLPALATAQTSDTDEDNSMNEEQLKALREALGLAADADVSAVLAAVAVHVANTTALASVAEKVGLAKDAGSDAIVAAAHAAPTDGQFVPRTEFDRVATQLATLQTESAESKAAAAVDAAMQAGKVAPASRQWALDYAKSNPDGFATYVQAAPKVVTPGASGQATGTPPDPDAALTSDELAVCRAMGIKPDDFKASRKDVHERLAAG